MIWLPLFLLGWALSYSVLRQKFLPDISCSVNNSAIKDFVSSPGVWFFLIRALYLVASKVNVSPSTSPPTTRCPVKLSSPTTGMTCVSGRIKCLLAALKLWGLTSESLPRVLIYRFLFPLQSWTLFFSWFFSDPKMFTAQNNIDMEYSKLS